MVSIAESFDKYQVKEVLGEGAMGVVYSGHDPRIGRDVAIKTIHAHLLQGQDGEDLRKRFTLEVKAVGKMSHPNIVAIYDTDEIANDSGVMIPYFVMEFVKGRELEHYLSGHQRFPLGKTLDIAGQILDAFTYTHKHNIIHRDIKPANIFITDDDQVKIADFGIARMDNSSMTQTGAVIGTPNYMSPEQCTGQVMDSRSDLFSIAIVIYEMLTGEQPFNANNVHAVMVKVVQSNPEAPSILNPTLPKGLDSVMAKALAKSPDDRYQTAAEFKQALANFDKSVAPAGNGATVVVDNATRIMDTASVTQRRKSNKPIAIAAVLVVLLGVLGAGGYYYTLLPKTDENSLEYLQSVPMESLPAYASDLSEENKTKVDRLFVSASASERSNRLITPQGSNAAWVYNQILTMDPGNQRAQHGLKMIEARLVQQGLEYLENKEYLLLENHLIVSQETFPNNEGLIDLKRKLDKVY